MTIAVGFTILLLGVVAIAGCGTPENDAGESSRPSAESARVSAQLPDVFGVGLAQSTGVTRFSIEYPVDVKDQPRLAGFADAIFVGRVRTTAALETSNPPSRILELTILTVLKGAEKAGETVSAVQMGGFNERTLYIAEGDHLCSTGSTYLFAATSSDGQLKVVSRYGNQSVRDVNDPKVDAMRQSIANQIPFQ